MTSILPLRYLPTTRDEADRFLLRALLCHIGIGDGTDPSPPHETAYSFDYYEEGEVWLKASAAARKVSKLWVQEMFAPTPPASDRPLEGRDVVSQPNGMTPNPPPLPGSAPARESDLEGRS